MSNPTPDQITPDDDGIEDRVNENFQAACAAMGFARHKTASTGLTLGLYKGISPLTGNEVPAWSDTLPANSTVYVQLNDDDTVSFSTDDDSPAPPIGWPNSMPGAWAIGVATTGSASIATWSDLRWFGSVFGGVVGSYDTGTFILTLTAPDGKKYEIGPFA